MGFPWVWREGSVTVDGKPMAALSDRERAFTVGYLPQDPPVPQGLTVRETVLLGRHPFRNPWATDSPADMEAAHRVMEECDVTHLSSRLASNLSGGERRMVFLASVLAQTPGILLLDEPGGGLDYRHTVMLWEILEGLADRGVSVLASTHRLGMAGEHFDGAVVLSRGECLGIGKPDQIFTSELMTSVYRIPLGVTRDAGTGGWSVSAGRRR